jgi:hypothetical protein
LGTARFIRCTTSPNHARRIRSAIDEVAKHDNRGLRCGTRGIVAFDLFGQRAKQIKTAMHVADGVDPRARWQRGRGPGAARPE